MTRFSVTGMVAGFGVINHVIKAWDEKAAWERFRRAHADDRCELIKIEDVGRFWA